MSDASDHSSSNSPLQSSINATPSQCVAIRSPDASRMCSAWAPPLALDLALLRSLQSFNASSLAPPNQLPASSSSTSSFESPADALDQALVQLARESYLSSRLARPRTSCRPLFDLRYAQSYWCAQILSLSHSRCNGTKLGFAPPPPVCLPTCMAFTDSVRSSQCAGSAVTALARCSFTFPAVNEPCIDGIRVEASTCGLTRPNAIGCKCQGVDPSKYPCVKDPEEPGTPPPSSAGPPGNDTSAPGLSAGEPNGAATIAVVTVSAVVLVTGVLLGILLYRRRQQRTKLRAFSVPVRDADLVNPALLAAANGPMPSSPSSTSLTLGGGGGRHDMDGSESPKPSHPLPPRMASVSPPVTSSDLTLPTARPTSAHLMDVGDDLADLITPPSMAALPPLVPSSTAALVAPGDLHGNLPSRQSSLSSATGYYPTSLRRKSPVASRAAFPPDPTTMSLYAASEVSSVFANPITMKVVALFTATRSDEIAGVALGDVLRVYKTYVDNWCLVLTDKDEEGYMPLACLEPVAPMPSPSVELPVSPLSRPLAGTLVIETSPTALSPIPSSGLASTASSGSPSPSPTSRLVLDLGGTRRESLYLSQDDVGESWSVMEQLAGEDGQRVGGESDVPPVPVRMHESRQ